MSIEEIFSNLIAHMKKGVIIHDQMNIIYNFLNLHGYQKWHEHQFYEESENYKEVQNYYLTNYQKIAPEIDFEKPNLIPSNWYKHVKIDVDTGTKKSTIKDLMKKWVDWEQETCDLLKKYSKNLIELGDLGAANKLNYFLEETQKELELARREYLNLEALGYDIIHIIEEQDKIYKKYKK